MNVFDLINADFANVTSRVTVAEDCGFIIVGADSPQYLAESDRQRNEGQAYRRAANKGDVPKIDTDTDEGMAIFNARTQANLHAVALACTVGWFGFTDAAGAEIPFDLSIAAQMFTKKRAWRDAVITAIDEDKRFLPQPAKG
jgi:hypothetical protein